MDKPKVNTTYNMLDWALPWGSYSPIYIVIHFTGGIDDSYNGLVSTYNLYKSNNVNAHYIVGRDTILEVVDPKIYYCTRSCGASVGRKSVCKLPNWGPSKTGYNSPLLGDHSKLAGHTNTINIEVSSIKEGYKSLLPRTLGWKFSPDTYRNAVNLTAWLCSEFNIKTDNIIMHAQVTSKLCPAMWCNKEGAENGFYAFKADVGALLCDLDPAYNNLAKPSDPQSVTIPVESSFYSRPTNLSPCVYINQKEIKTTYTLQENNYIYTPYGWVEY